MLIKKLLPIIINILSMGLLAQAAQACSTCAFTGNQKFFSITLVAVVVLWAVPVLLAAFIVWRIMKINKHEHAQ